MFHEKPDARRRSIPLAVALCASTFAAPAFGQDATDGGGGDGRTPEAKHPTVSRARPVSPNATINLVHLLVKQGVLSEEQAQALIKQAANEAFVQQQAARDATAKAGDAAKAATAAAAAAAPHGAKHVTYVPEVVKRQLRDEIKKEVMARAEKENWASPGIFPEWATRIRFYGDMRVRYHGSYFPSGNDQIGAINFNAINTGSPYLAVDGNDYYWPTYNVVQDRNQFRFRGRLGMVADLHEGFTAGLRLAGGENNSPVSQNQTFGANGGNFSKYAVWIDRAYMKYQPSPDFSLTAGRMDNPFWSPTDLVWYKDIGFDGFAAQAKYEIVEGVTPFVAGGAFPIFNTDFNAGINLPSIAGNNNAAPTKLPSRDKWLFAGQLGVAVKPDPDYAVRLGVAYYDFSNVQGQLSAPCSVVSATDVCSTDLTRPSFAQKGNTYTPLRNITPDPIYANTLNYYQYYGLVGQFRPVVASGQIDFARFHPVHVVLDGEYVVNTAFDRRAMELLAVNNRAGTPNGALGGYDGGNMGYLVRATVGEKEIKRLWDWNVHAGYKYLQSDAMVDAFVDSDFGLGGTNLKGYFVGGNIGVGENTWLALRWMSANNIAGSPYAVDVLHVDLNGKF